MQMLGHKLLLDLANFLLFGMFTCESRNIYTSSINFGLGSVQMNDK